MRRVRVLLGALILLLALAGCGSAPSASGPRATATPSPTAAPRVVYQADWASGPGQWSASSGWKYSASGMTTDGLTNANLILPYTPAAGSYTVVLVAQISSVVGASPCNNQYGLQGVSPASDIVFEAGVNCVDHQYHGSAEVFSANASGSVAGTDSNTFATYDYTPGTSSRIYTITVDGPYVSFSLNDSFLGTVKCGQPTAPVKLVFFSSGLAMQVQRVTITTP